MKNNNLIESYGTFTDKQGVKYKTITYTNGQTWLAENLRTFTEDSVYHEGEESSFKNYGRFYSENDLHEVIPEGWRLPNKKDYLEFIDILGGQEFAANSMRSLDAWDIENSKLTNSSEFNILPSGYCLKFQKKNNMVGEYSVLWISKKGRRDHTDYVSIYNKSPLVGFGNSNPYMMLPVRLIKK